MYNYIIKYNEKAVWAHQNVDSIDMGDNIGMTTPLAQSTVSMPSLQYLNLGNNTMNINWIFDTSRYPNMKYLYLNGNNLMFFPIHQSMKNTLLELAIARCNVTVLKSYLSTFRFLKYLDCRNNNITMVHNSIKTMIKSVFTLLGRLTSISLNLNIFYSL